jgi:hypothetical protein
MPITVDGKSYADVAAWNNAMDAQAVQNEAANLPSAAAPRNLAVSPDLLAAMLWDRYFERSAGGPGSASGGMAGHRIGGRFAGMGPQPGSLGAAMAPMRLAGGEPASSLSPGPLANLQLQAQPQQAATASPAPIARHPVAPLQPIPISPAPNLHKGYQEALASILNGQRRGFGSIFG